MSRKLGAIQLHHRDSSLSGSYKQPDRWDRCLKRPQHWRFCSGCGVNAENIRFYQRKGLISEPDKPPGRIRRYGRADVMQVQFVKSAQRLGFSLDEIAELLRLQDGTQCNEVRMHAELTLMSVRQKLIDLTRIQSVLSSHVQQCCLTISTLTSPLIFLLHSGAGA